MKNITLIAFIFLFNQFTAAQVPPWSWAKASVGTGPYDVYTDAAIDATGNLYVVGGFSSDTLHIGNHLLIKQGTYGYDICLVKYDPSGNVIWAKGIGSTSSESGGQIAIDAYGGIYFTGGFQGTTLTLGNTILTNSHPPFNNLFVAKCDTSGNFIWAFSVGASLGDDATGIAVDNQNNIVVSAAFENQSFDFHGVAITNCNGFVVAKLDTAGTTQWVTTGIHGGVYINGIAVDQSGNIYVAMQFSGDSITLGNFTLMNHVSNEYDAAIAALNSSGNVLWAKSAGDSLHDIGSGVSVDSAGMVYFCGSYESAEIRFDNDTLHNPYPGLGQTDAFLVKYDNAGNELWARGATGTNSEVGISLITDHSNNVYMAGIFQFDSCIFNTDTLIYAGSVDNFLVKYDENGNYLWGTVIGDIWDEYVDFIVGDGANTLYALGTFNSSNLAFGIDTVHSDGTNDMVLAKMDLATGVTCNSNFSLVPDTLLPHHYWALNMATGNGPLNYLWSWGDGTYDSIAYPSHTYVAAGFYTICLTIHDSTGCTDSICINYNIQKLSAENTIVKVDVVEFIPTNVQITNVLQSLSLFPNPSSGNSFINYTLSTHATVSIALYDVLGNKLRQLVNGDQEQGEHNAIIDARKLANGVYVLQIRAGGQMAEEKIVVVD